MKKLIAPLALLLVVPACGGERKEAPPPQPPATPPETLPETPAETAEAPQEPPAEPAPPVKKTDLIQDTVRALVAAFNAHDARRIASLYTPDATVAGVTAQGWTEASGRNQIENSYNYLFAVLPDVQWASPRVFVGEDAAIQEWVVTGTHRGAAGSTKATNRTTGVHGATVHFFDDEGRIRAQHTYYDPIAIGTQLGLEKGKGRAAATLPAGETQLVLAENLPNRDRHLDAARSFYGAYQDRDEKVFLAILAPEVTRTSYNLPEDRKGHKAVVEEFRIFVKAFPDIQVDTKHLWGFGDQVVAENVVTTKKAGAWGGARATQKPATLHTLDILGFNEDGKITSIVSYGSAAELTLQGGQDQKQRPHPWLPGAGAGQGTTPGHGTTP